MEKRTFSWLPFIILLFAGVNTFAQNKPTKGPWEPLQFLIGRWTGVGSGKPKQAVSGVTEFTFDLDENIIIRRNTTQLSGKDEDTVGAIHNDLLVIYRIANATSFKAIYFDNEGHIINYTLSFADQANSVVFESEALPGSPRFRLVYTLRTDGSLVNDFFIAPPGREFSKYLSGILKHAS